MRRKELMLAALCAALFMTGCAGGSSAEIETTTAEITAEQTTAEITTTAEEATTVAPTTAEFTDYRSAVELRTDYVTDDYMQKALGFDKYVDKNAIADVMKKAAAGEEITIACIGGSITQGTISSGKADAEVKEKVGSDCYANIFFDWWKKAFPNTKINCINAGIGATTSYLGVHRVQKDVLDKKPDLVLVEFSVNDSGVRGNQTSYENLVRQILSDENSPAVMLLFMGMTNGSNAQVTHQEIGLSYNLPMVSYADLITKYMADGVYTDKDLAGDGVHPTVLGHAITGELLWKYMNDIYAHMDGLEPAKKFDASRDWITSDKYMKCDILDSMSMDAIALGSFSKSSKFVTFPNDWTSTEGKGGITFSAAFKNLGVMYYCITNGKGAKYDVYVDGEKVGTLNSDFKGGWGNYAETAEVYKSDETALHEISFVKSDDSKGEEFTILGLLVSE